MRHELFRSLRIRRGLWAICACASLSCSEMARGTGPASPPQVALAAPPMLVLVDREHGSLSILDTSKKDVVATIAVDRVGQAAVSPDGRTVFASVPAGIAVIDVAAQKVSRTLPLAGELTGLTVAGGVLYVIESGTENGKISALDLASGRVTLEGKLRSISGSGALTLDGRRLFIPHHYYSGFVTVLDTATLRERKSLEFEDGAGRVRLTPDERWLLVPNGSTFSGRVSIVDTATLRPAGEIALTGEPTDVAIAPDGKRAWVTQFREHLVAVIDLAGRKVERTIAVADYPTRIALDPDGGTAFVIHNGSNRLSVIDIATGTVDLRQLPIDPIEIAMPGRLTGTR